MDISSTLLAMAKLGEVDIVELAKEYPEVVNELRPLGAVQAAAVFAGLLAKPELQANCLRIEALVHFAVIYCGGSEAPTEGFVRRAFDSLNEGYFGRNEDPAEDVFVALVNTPKGNFRIFEGIREGNAFYLQRMLNVLDLMPEGGPYDHVRESVESLLKISDEIANRAGSREYTLGGELRLDVLPSGLELSRLRGLVEFGERDLERLHVTRESLAEFVFDLETRDRLAQQRFGNTDLERRPIASVGASLFVLLPTAVGAAITRLMIEFVVSIKQAEEFERALAIDFAGCFEAPLFGPAIPIRFQRVEGGRVGVLVKEVDKGRYLNLVFFVDGLTDFFEGGLLGANSAPEALASTLTLIIRRVSEKAKTKPGFIDGLTLLVGCGYGRGLCVALEEDLPENWRLESIAAHDLVTLSWSEDFDCISFWRILDAQRTVATLGIELFNLNGFLNLVAWAFENKGHLVPHGQLPDDFMANEGPGLVQINQNSLLRLRHKVLTSWDSRRVLDTTGRWIAVKKFERTYFEEDNNAPLYVSVEELGRGRLRAVYTAPNRAWWIEIHFPENVDRHYGFEHWMMLCMWLRRLAPVLDGLYTALPEGPVSLHVTFSEIVGVSPGGVAPKYTDELRSLIRVVSYPGDAHIQVEVQAGFDDGLLNPANIAERALVEAMVSGVAAAAGEGNNAEKRDSAVVTICPNAEIRHMHRFETHSFRDALISQIGRKPLLIDQFDHAASLLGLGWRDRSRELGSEVVGVSDCTTYLNRTVDILIDEICDILRQLDRRSVIKSLLSIHESASCDRDAWRRTAQANLAIHDDRKAALAAIVDRLGQLGKCFTLSRILIEAANCECPIEGGRDPGVLDLSRLMSRAFLAFSLGGDSDAVKYGAMEPRIWITPLGDVHMKRSFAYKIYEPFARVAGEAQVQHAVKRYANLYSPRPVIDSPVDMGEASFLHAWGAEFGTSPEGIGNFLVCIEKLGKERNEAILSMPRATLVSMLAEAGNYSMQGASQTLDLLTLESRPKWWVVPEGFKNRDWQPWCFGRRLSVLRRPFLQIEGGENAEVIFAPGLVREALLATIQWYYEGEIHQSEALSAEMESWIVKAQKGSALPLDVEAKLKELGWKTEIEIEVTDVLGRGFDPKFGELKRFGDVDVLAFRKDSARVLIIECKDLQPRKTPGEVAKQLADYRGECKPNGKPDLLKRHLDRIEVLTANANAVAKRFKLAGPIRIEGHLIFRDPVPMRFAWESIASRIQLSTLDEVDQLSRG